MIKGDRSGPEEKRLQGHWLLAKMGKRVLRPGGRELTAALLVELAVGPDDAVVEFGPGLGITARQLLAAGPKSYTAVDPNPEGEPAMRALLDSRSDARLVTGSAQDSGLPDGSAQVVVIEAMLTMQSPEDKRRIAQEVARILAPGGRLGLHELAFVPDEVSDHVVSEVSKTIGRVIKVGARPLRATEWQTLLEEVGLEVSWQHTTPMALLEPRRIIADEGLLRFLKFVFNVLRTKAARQRIRAMRAVFREHAENLAGIGLVARKPS
ncbi:class I SAM-dependent methyltransferase [Tessaracoccus sp. OH4464_COT-324]|uniref:class I SAM-dependent methyltransferase n=1 Tax=Tessaracoccus sp. OH4464_COT-324 TaxID=2491059 RepID=UPI000F6366B0|nr:class I SAM-dependent methyltransferase [Tessaracoccus sp. OH4464_COT-324]RRD46051.1 class I SAM-dependent methyltransferase [Tessaracoccus sp. OH4464_COT-324]